ncbi:uncharacterized protein KY384_008182 [Bacidia gigantensis]|uniref:uncharacterized protein n=1 Tax=Bacidia gigantensis TaxID=2732470 RepID=UPI001D05A346|nr:uncharacterized protein KY384_008182 [Bacidia gigantensis]KAG8526753.1 hypothetical protein KY384_008182 [Bacidia gigantensis]
MDPAEPSYSIQTPETGRLKEVSAEPSLSSSQDGPKFHKEKHRVQWNRGGETLDIQNIRATFELPSNGSSESEEDARSPPKPKERVATRRGTSAGAVLQVSKQNHSSPSLPAPSTSVSAGPKPPILRKAALEPKQEEAALSEGNEPDDKGSTSEQERNDSGTLREAAGKAFSQRSAQQRAERLSRSVGIRSAPGSRYTSPVRDPLTSEKRAAQSPPPSPQNGRQPKFDLTDIPLEKLETRRTYGIDDDTDDENEEKGVKPKRNEIKTRLHSAARHLLKHHTHRDPAKWFKFQAEEPPLKSGQTTPIAERDPYDYVPPPKQYREGVFGSLIKLYNEQGMGAALAKGPLGNTYRRHSDTHSILDSEKTTPIPTPPDSRVGSISSSGSYSPGGSPKIKREKWYYKNSQPYSTGSIADLVSSSTSLAQPTMAQTGGAIKPSPKQKPLKSQAYDAITGRKPQKDQVIQIHMHVADVMQRKAYLLKICRALMAYGAPTHRLEEYMRMSARVLQIDSQFLYMPGCMIVSFGDAAWQTTDVRIVRCAQSVNLSKLYDTHAIYKEVLHDKIGADEAISRLDEINGSQNRFHPWLLVLVYGFASVCVGPFAFGARPIDLPLAFVLGCLLGFMQLIVAPRSELYSNIFEISAAVLTSFLARAFGSIRGGSVFCFSALAQSSIALILPGYIVLCGSLELQSKNILAGSVRMVYAIIYSLFLGFGITVGTSIYGAIDSHATSATVCTTTWPFWWQIIFVLPFTLCLIIINQGKWKKMPPMLVLAMVGYLVNHYSAQRFASNAQIAQTLGALAIGVLANLYSRLRHGLAAAVLLPAIFVQVPSGLAASGSLISGVTSANQITHQITTGGATTVSNGTQAGGGPGAVEVNTAVLNVGYSMIQIAIGITVGLFMSALVVYPFGKRRSGLFSF